jgi:hypothetical protein
MDFREIGWGVEWIRLAQDRYRWGAAVNTVVDIRVLALFSQSEDNISASL